MKGTFKPGDKLIIEKVQFDHLKKGDVIIFRRAHEDQSNFIVHRISGITSEGLVSRGDNCFDNDKWLLSEKDIVGRVIQYDRRKIIRKSRNSFLGVFRSVMLRCRLKVKKHVMFFLNKPYKFIKKSGVIAKIWHPEIKIFLFEILNDQLVKYMHRNRTIALKRIKSHHCWQKRPYDFIL